MNVKICRRDHTPTVLLKLKKLLLQAEKFLIYDQKNYMATIWLILLSDLSAADTLNHLLYTY